MPVLSVCDCVCTCDENSKQQQRRSSKDPSVRSSRRVMFRDECDCDNSQDWDERTETAAAAVMRGGGRGGPGRRCDCCPQQQQQQQEEHYQSPKDVDGDYSYAYRYCEKTTLN